MRFWIMNKGGLADALCTRPFAWWRGRRRAKFYQWFAGSQICTRQHPSAVTQAKSVFSFTPTGALYQRDSLFTDATGSSELLPFLSGFDGLEFWTGTFTLSFVVKEYQLLVVLLLQGDSFKGLVNICSFSLYFCIFFIKILIYLIPTFLFSNFCTYTPKRYSKSTSI